MNGSLVLNSFPASPCQQLPPKAYLKTSLYFTIKLSHFPLLPLNHCQTQVMVAYSLVIGGSEMKSLCLLSFECSSFISILPNMYREYEQAIKNREKEKRKKSKVYVNLIDFHNIQINANGTHISD